MHINSGHIISKVPYMNLLPPVVLLNPMLRGLRTGCKTPIECLCRLKCREIGIGTVINLRTAI